MRTSGRLRSRRAMPKFCEIAADLQPSWALRCGRCGCPPRRRARPARSRQPWCARHALYAARRYEEAVTAFAEAISLAPDFKRTYGQRGLAYYGLGDLERARASCETKPDHWESQQCLAVIYDKLGRHADAEAELAKMKAAFGDAMAYQ